MKGERVHEYVVPFSATDMWEVVSTLELPNLVKNMAGVLKDLTVVGDGSVGTIFNLVVPDGWPFQTYRERIATLDHATKLKEVNVVEGGVLNFGFTFCQTRFEVIYQGPTTSMFRGTIVFEIDDTKATQKVVDMVDLMAMDSIAKAIANYIVDKMSHPRKLVGEQSFDQELPYPAAAVWDVYSTFKLYQLFRKVFLDVQWQGDGSVGTIFSFTLNPGSNIPNFKERLVRQDQEERIKELDVIEGGVLEKDFTFYRKRIQIVENGPNSTVVKNIIMYELNANSATAAENMKLANVMITKIAGELTSDYLKNQYKLGA